jgi:hypothetical protein
MINHGTFVLKADLARRLVSAFVGTNAFVALIVLLLVLVDMRVVDKDPNLKLIDHQVTMTLIGATTVQVGIIAIGLLRRCFQEAERRNNKPI